MAYLAKQLTHNGNLAPSKLDSGGVADKTVHAVAAHHPRIDILLDSPVGIADCGRNTRSILLQRHQFRLIFRPNRVLREEELTQSLLEIILADLVVKWEPCREDSGFHII